MVEKKETRESLRVRSDKYLEREKNRKLRNTMEACTFSTRS